MQEILKMYNDDINTNTYEDTVFIVYKSQDLLMKFNKETKGFSIKEQSDSVERYYIDTIEDFTIFSLEMLGDIITHLHRNITLLEMEFVKYIAMRCFCENPDYKI